MNEKLQVFVSSVQRELEDERLIVQNLLNTDPFLAAHTSSVLYEFEPASPEKALEGCLRSLDECEVYLLMIWSQYGTAVGSISITHAEYRRAKEKGLPVLVFIKGDRHLKREPGVLELIKEVEEEGFKYKRFGNVIELQKEVRAALVKLLRDRFGLTPSSDENEIAEQTIEATSPFESQTLARMKWSDLDQDLGRQLVATAEQVDPDSLSDDEVLSGAMLRGLVWTDPDSGETWATAAGIVLLGKDPSVVLPQCRIIADAYRGSEADGDPIDSDDIRQPAPIAIDRAIAFVDRNTRHPMRVVGLNRVRMDEYPVAALREVLVNAVAHRVYENAGRKILLEVFSDRVVVSSPGLPPSPITIAKLRKGKYRPCSRNPVLAQCLSYFQKIEERGSGFRRMRSAMLDHGLEPPLIGTDTGFFQITLTGPGQNIDKLPVPADRILVAPSVEDQLNSRQREIMAQALEDGTVTTKWCMEHLDVSRDTAHRDLSHLLELGLLVRRGAGRAVRYVPSDRGTGE